MSDPFIGQIMQVGFSYAPVDWLTCSGQVLPLAQNQALFALLGTNFGGDGTSNFGLPDARGRAFIGAGQGPGLANHNIGAKGGQEIETLTLTNLPNHTHGATVSGGSLVVQVGLNALSGVAAGDEAATPTPGAQLGTALEQDTTPVLYVPAGTQGTNVPLGGVVVNYQYQPPNMSISATGLGQGFSIMQPFQAVTTIIATNGIWPSRPN